MAKPDYATLLAQIAAEPDSAAKQRLIDRTYKFEELLTQDEKDLFDYVEPGYIDKNAGVREGEYKSYVGIRFSPTGDRTS